MTLNVNAAANSTQNVGAVFNGTDPRRIAPQSTTQGETRTELPQGRGVKASSAVIERLDDERREQTSYRAGTDRRSQQAIEAYQSQANEQRRSEVQSLLGVDLYA